MGTKSIIGIIAGLVVVSYQMATGAFTNFIVAGIITGTQHAWAMFGICCLAITVVITLFVEDFVVTIRRGTANTAPKQQLPKRRYTAL